MSELTEAIRRHGDPDYRMPNGLSVRHVDLRERKPRKKKETSHEHRRPT